MDLADVRMALHDLECANEKGEQDFSLLVAIHNQLIPAPGEDSPDCVAMHIAEVLRERMEAVTIPKSIKSVLKQLAAELSASERRTEVAN